MVVSLIQIYNSIQKISTQGLKKRTVRENHAEDMPSSSVEASLKVILVPPREFHSWSYHASGGPAAPRVGQQEDVAFEPCQLLVLSVAPNSSIIQDNEPSVIPQELSGLFLYL